MTTTNSHPVSIRVLIALDSLGDIITAAEAALYRANVISKITEYYPTAKIHVDVEQRVHTTVLVDAPTPTEEHETETTVDYLLTTVWDDTVWNDFAESK